MNNRILIVDDEKEIVSAYCEFLSPQPLGTIKKSSRLATSPAQNVSAPDYEIFTAHSGEQARKLFQKQWDLGIRFSAGFFDVKLGPGIDGLQLIQDLWKIDPQLHCTVVTAYQDRSVHDIDKLFGARFKDQWDYLNKPFYQSEILQKARQMVAAWNRMRTLEHAFEQLKAKQAQLVQSERLAAIGQVARGIGHEFGNILQTVIGKADLAISEKDPVRLEEKLRAILRAGERAAVIIRNLQSFSKPSAAQSPVDLGSVIEETLSLINHELVKASVKYEDQRNQSETVVANAAELEQVLLNLVMNAIHAMPKGGVLQLGCKSSAQESILWVKDSGTGIEPEVLPKIFEYAFTTKGDRGSGLGLSISKEIIERHGGRIEVCSVLGQGTQFNLIFPRKS